MSDKRNSKFNQSVIITAGGIGKRMNSEVPKQFLLLGNTPVLMHTIRKFYSFDNSIEIIVTLPKEWWSYWSDLCEKYNFHIPLQLIEGGKDRFHSVQKAVQLAKGEIIAVHDGVRPLVSLKTIEEAFDLAREKGSAVPVVRLKDSIRKLSTNKNEAVDRDQYVLVHTPQIFRSDWLKKAYEQSFSKEITDDASLIEKSGNPIFLSKSNEENLKITTPNDLKTAETHIQS